MGSNLAASPFRLAPVPAELPAKRDCRLVVVVLLLLGALCAPPGAGAHLRNGTIAVDYRASISRPALAFRSAFRAQVYGSDRALYLTVEPGHTIVVLGYIGEPFIRLNRSGLAINRASPTAAGSRLLHGTKRVSGTGTAWLLEPGRKSVVWHDARVQGLAPGVDAGRWSVGLLVDGRPTQLEGELRRLRHPELWPWLAVLALFVAGSTLLATTRTRETARRGSIALGCVAGFAAIVVALAFALDRYASPGSWIAGADELVFALVGFGVLRLGPRQAHVAAGTGLGLLSVAIGLSKGPVFLHALPLAVLPGTATRLLVAVAIAAGTAAVILGGAYYLEAAHDHSL